MALTQRDNDNATDGCDIGCESPRGISIPYLRESREAGTVWVQTKSRTAVASPVAST